MLSYIKSLHRVNFEEVTIDTRIEKSHYTVGETVNGEVVVNGGSSDSSLGYVYIYLKTECATNPLKPLQKTEVLLDKYVISQPFTLRAQQNVKLPFSFKLPFHTPITYRSVKVYLHSGLDLHAGEDPEDIDFIEVGPSPLQDRIFQLINEMGFESGRTKYVQMGEKQYAQIFNFKRELETTEQIAVEFLSNSLNEMILYVKNEGKEMIISINEAESDEDIRTKLNFIVK